METEVPAAKGFSIIATANTRDRGVNDMSAALKRRFNIVVLPTPNTLEIEMDIVRKRVTDLATNLELKAELPAADAVEKVVTVFRELRLGQTLDGKNKVKTPSGVLSTAEAISVLANSMALAGNFGTGSVTARDIAAGLQGSIVKDEEKDRAVWEEYLTNVMKKRGADWRALYTFVCGAQRVMSWQIPVFGVRHLSPAGAWHLRRYLDEIRPSVVLVEGLADAGDVIPHITRKGTKPPIAILAYTDSLPVRTLAYPLARYSPEYQALMWAKENNARVEFIDLPSSIFLALQDVEAELRVEALKKQAKADSSFEESSETAAAEPADGTDPQPSNESHRSLYEEVARFNHEPDYDTYWERRFEHNRCFDSYRLAAFELGQSLRDVEQDRPRWRAESLVREAFMRRQIEAVLAKGIAPEKVVAVVGAFHAPVLNGNHPAMTDEELKSLRRRDSKLTLMPYSYFKLSTQSGYGAGNQAPAYFELLWDALERNELEELPNRYLALVTRRLRSAGTHRSTAEIIEGVRLARTLSAMKDGFAPTLRDLRDSAITLIGHGELSVVQEALAHVDVGTAIGELPEGVSRTSIQEDFERELRILKLDKYNTTVKQELALDLRENRRVKNAEAAFLDLHRSAFLHRLRVLEIGFAVCVSSKQQSVNWAEHWHLQWSPENEIALVEAVLMGETVELATGFQFKTRLDDCLNVAAAAEMVHDACLCHLMSSMELARNRLQELATESAEFAAVAHAAHQLALVVRYGDVRQFDPAPLMPLIGELFVQGTLALFPSANCDNQAAVALMAGMDELNKVALEFHDDVEEPLWLAQLQSLAAADDRSPLLSGYACAILLERGLIANDELAKEVSRRLSPGIPADLGAGWFEGLSKRNRYALLARQPLWEQLARLCEFARG